MLRTTDDEHALLMSSHRRRWAVDALRAVNVDVLEDQPGVEPRGDAKWDVAE
jgi:hypothetical protein